MSTPEQDSVKKAYNSKRIITDNLDAEFNKAIAAKSSTQAYNNMLSSVVGGRNGTLKAFGPRSNTAFGVPRTATIDRIFDTPHNPFRSRLAVETPQSLMETYARYRYYFKFEPLVGTAIELHSEFPLSSFELQHEDPTLMEEFNAIAEDAKLFDFLLDMAHEYWLIGECFPFGIFDNPTDPSVWKSFVLLDPLSVQIQQTPLTDGRPNCSYKLKINNAIQTVVANGPHHRETGELYNRIPQDIKDACNGQGEGKGVLKLNDTQISHFKRKGDYFSLRGQSILTRIFHLLSYRDKLRDAQYSVADRHSSPREIWKVGNDLVPATAEEIAALGELVAASYLDPNQAIIWHHALQVEMIGAADKVLPLRQELDGIEEEMLIGLMLNKGFLDSNYGAYANMSVSLDVLINRYMTFRQRVEQWMSEHVWAPICRIHNIYKPTQAELSHRIRIKNAPKRPWVPKVAWQKQELRDSTQKINLMMTLREKLGVKGQNNGFPKAPIYQALGYNPAAIARQLKKEANEDIASGKAKVNIDNKGGPLGGGGLPDLSLDGGGLGGGSIPSGGPGGNLDIPDDQLPEFGGNKGVGPNNTPSPMPPDSQKIQNQNSPTS